MSELPPNPSLKQLKNQAEELEQTEVRHRIVIAGIMSVQQGDQPPIY